MMTFKQLIHDCRANSDTKQPQLLVTDLLTQILFVLVEIRDELAVRRPNKKNDFWPMDGNGGENESVVQTSIPTI
jgi:hypothetical protein